MRIIPPLVLVMTAGLLCACVGSKNTSAGGGMPPPTLNAMALTVDTGPAAASGQINHAYVTVKVCSPGSQSQCANIDHVLLDTGSSGLRLVGSVLAAAAVTPSRATDAQGQAVVECVTFGGGQTWGAVGGVDVTLAGEVAANLPVQILDDAGTGPPPPPTCGANGTLIDTVASIGANGLLGVGVFAQDCGAACVSANPALPVYFGCSSAGTCTAENIALAAQVTNPVAMFAADNNGVIVKLPNLINANGDVSIAGQLLFGIATQADNALPLTGLTVLGTDATGHFTATYNGGTTSLPALIDSGSDAYAFDDPNMAVCAAGPYVGYYCPAVAPQTVFAVNMGVGTMSATNTVNFAVADPNSFVASAAALGNLARGRGSIRFTWGLPFFFGRAVYVGLEQRTAGTYTGPYFAY